MTTNQISCPQIIQPLIRPLNDDGFVLTGFSTPPAPNELITRSLPAITNHLERACWWPKEEKGSGWQLGDFSFYILEFAVADGVKLFAQVWSEPDESICFEVASGAWDPPAEQFVTDSVKEALLNRGFEPGGRAGNFRKFVSLKRKDDCRRLARELIGVVTECLGYDARSPLAYKLHLGQRTRAAQVFDSLTFDDFGRLLQSCGFPIEPIEESHRTAYRTTVAPYFVAGLKGESEKRPGEFDGFVLSLYVSLAPAVLMAVEEELRSELPFARVSIDDDGDLAVSQPVIVRGGVTETHLRHLLGFWRSAIARVEKAIEKHSDAPDDRVLN